MDKCATQATQGHTGNVGHTKLFMAYIGRQATRACKEAHKAHTERDRAAAGAHNGAV